MEEGITFTANLVNGAVVTFSAITSGPTITSNITTGPTITANITTGAVGATGPTGPAAFAEAAQNITVVSNAGTADVSHGNQVFTNSSAANMTITLATSGAADKQKKIVSIYDFSGVAKGVTWVNTENSTATAPTTSNGSTTLPITAGFIFNGSTNLWRCVAAA